MLSNYQIGKIIAKRKIKEKIKNKSPLDLVKQQLSLGIDTGNNYIDEHLRKFNQEKTIGIIICKQDNKYVIKYCSDDRIIAREYELV